MNKLIILIFPFLLLSINLVECNSTKPGSVTVTKGLHYAKTLKRDQEVELLLDIYAPSQPGNWPIVIYLHDFGEKRTTSNQLPYAIAEQGAVVFNIDYPDIDPSVACLNEGNGHRKLDEITACSVRFARASEYGRDNAPIALAGFGWGGGIATHVALMGDSLYRRWAEYATVHGGPDCQCECAVSEGSVHVDALVGIAGAYDAFVGSEGEYGREFLQEKNPDLWQMLYGSIGENPDLKIRLLHAQDDSVIPYQNSVTFETLLSEHGYDAKLIPYTGGHTLPQEPTVQTIMSVFKR